MRDLAIRLETRASEAAELRTRLELTEQSQSTIEEERNRLAESLRQAEEQAEMLRKELDAERSKGFWHRLFAR
jgi:vacuolar-type H+-ATPase subunit D/Vma8